VFIPQKTRKNREITLKNWKILYSFSFFSKSTFSKEIRSFSLFFFHALRPIALQLFSWQLRSNWSAHFSLFEKNIASMNFGRFYKISSSQKMSVFQNGLRIPTFLMEGNSMERNKKK